MSKFAVFDIDGTLIRWQLYHAVVDKLAKQGKLGSSAQEKIHAARMRWKNREPDFGFSEYEVELIKQFEKALQKLSPEDFEEAVEAVINEYKNQTYVFTKELMSRLKDEGYTLLAISGSQEELVEKIASYYGFDDCIGTTYQTTKQHYTGKKDFPAQDKKQALERFIKKYDLSLEDSYAVGDSKSDASMLDMVENPIAFNPDAELFEIAKEKYWPIVIERKNMIYRLEYKDGIYQLTQSASGHQNLNSSFPRRRESM